MFTFQHDLDALIVASLGVISILWLGRNIYLAIKEMLQDQRDSLSGHSV